MRLLLLGNHHPIRAQLQQNPAVGLVVGLADHIGNPQLLQVQGGQHGGRQIAADGHNGAVEVAHPQRPQYFLVLAVAHHGLGHIVGHLLHRVAFGING